MNNSSSDDTGKHSDKTSIIAKTFHFIALIAFSIMTAWAVGRLIGRSQHDSIVLAAILPVLLSGAWGLISLKFANVDNREIDTSLLSTTFAMILFLYMLIYASHSSDYDEEVKAEVKARAYFEDCSYNEFIVNNAREALKLPPLKSELSATGKTA